VRGLNSYFDYAVRIVLWGASLGFISPLFCFQSWCDGF